MSNVWDLTQPTAKARTLVFLLREDDGVSEILLGHKKVRFGAGKYGGIGGKLDKGETLLDAAVREMQEESSVILNPTDLSHQAHLSFWFPHRPEWTQTAYVFTATHWQGTAKESEEIRPCWLPYHQIPYEKMWDDAQYWLPHLLSGRRFAAEFTYGADNNRITGHQITQLPHQL